MTPTNIHFNFILVRIFHHSSTLPKTELYFWASASATSRLNCSSTQNFNPDKICNRIWKHDIIYDATMGYQGITCQQCELKRNCTGCRGRKRYTIYNGGTSNQTKSKNTKFSLPDRVQVECSWDTIRVVLVVLWHRLPPKTLYLSTPCAYIQPQLKRYAKNRSRKRKNPKGKSRFAKG